MSPRIGLVARRESGREPSFGTRDAATAFCTPAHYIMVKLTVVGSHQSRWFQPIRLPPGAEDIYQSDYSRTITLILPASPEVSIIEIVRDVVHTQSTRFEPHLAQSQ